MDNSYNYIPTAKLEATRMEDRNSSLSHVWHFQPNFPEYFAYLTLLQKRVLCLEGTSAYPPSPGEVSSLYWIFFDNFYQDK